MKQNLYIIHTREGEPSTPLEGARAIRAARGLLGDPAAMDEALDIARLAEERGYAVVFDGSFQDVERPDLSEAVRKLSRVGYNVRMNVQDEAILAAEVEKGSPLNPEEALAANDAADASARAIEQAPDAPPDEDVRAGNLITQGMRDGFDADAYKLALVLVVQAHGNPLEASVNARMLGKTTGDMDRYAPVIGALISCFPWIAEHLLQVVGK